MMYKRICILFLLIFSIPTFALAESDKSIATLKNTSGNVTILRGDENIKGVAGTLLKNNDVVMTSSNSSTGIIFIDNTRLSLGENTEVSLDKYRFIPVNEDFAFSLFIKKGKAVYSSGKISKLAPEKINVQTPRATIGVRGTKFAVEVD